jgi:5-(carboxyamino)imidazole ribonucleotide mutase
MTQVSVVMGSKSDQELGDKTTKTLEQFNIPHTLHIISAHRNPQALTQHIQNTSAQVFIAIAGLSAALPGAIAAQTIRPVIGVPKNAQLAGLDALLSIAQMPPGVPVATVGIDNPTNAALLAAQILALNNPELAQMLNQYREKKART